MKKAISNARSRRASMALAALLVCVAAYSNASVKGTPGIPVTGANPGQPPALHGAFELLPQLHTPASPQDDANCFLLNPQWGWQIDNPVVDGKLSLDNFPDSISSKVCNEDFSNCVGDNHPPQKDEPPKLLCPMCSFGQKNHLRIHGHYNWFPATYTGTICFHNFSYPDLDYTFSLKPDGRAGLTRWNAPSEKDEDKQKTCGPDGHQLCIPQVFHVEFDSRETVERFRTKDWTDFRADASPCNVVQIKSCNQDKARKQIQLKRAVVIGLVGLDSVHNIYSELHPVYAIAIEMNPGTRAPNGTIKNNTWLIFARNDGYEGACSVSSHPLVKSPDSLTPLENLKLLIPPPQGMAVNGASYADNTRFYSNNSKCPSISYVEKLFQAKSDTSPDYTVNNQGVLVDFDLSPCQDNGSAVNSSDCTPLIEGVLHLDWNPSPLEAAAFAPQVPVEDVCLNLEKYDKEEEKGISKPTQRQARDIFQLLKQARVEALSVDEKGCPFTGQIARAQPAQICTERFAKIPSGGGSAQAMAAGGERVSEHYRRIIEILNNRR
jgi:hypothetical protein